MWIPETGSESARVLLHGNHWTWKIRKHWHCHQLSIKRWTSIVSVTLCRALQKHLKRPHHHQSTVIKVDEKIEREGTHPGIKLIQCGTIINCPWCDYKIYLSYANNNNLWQLRCSRRICNEWRGCDCSCINGIQKMFLYQIIIAVARLVCFCLFRVGLYREVEPRRI